ncbi:unnamed protein product [Penicillium nalgiovense]|nr:unnamed protein product [Penicillium nalgiovense]
MSSTFNDQTQGTDVTKTFPDRVKQKTCSTAPTTPYYQTNQLATTVLISGLKRGDLAAATADALAHGGAGTIIYTGGSQSEVQPVVDHINRKYKTVKMIFVTADSGSLTSFRKAADTIKELGVSIDGFVGFPEVMAVPWELTEDGLESHFQRNYLCYFLLLNLLCDIMKPGSRVVLVTSSLRNEAPAPSWDDLGFENGENYHSLDGYSQSMLAIVLFIKSIAKRYSGSIVAFSANPVSELTGGCLFRFLMFLILIRFRYQNQRPDVSVQSGAFLDHCQTPKLPHLDFPAGEESAEVLWKRSHELIESFLS